MVSKQITIVTEENMQRMLSLGLYSLYVFEQHYPECNGNFLLVRGEKKDTNKNTHDDM